jgi:hypothetical protein
MDNSFWTNVYQQIHNFWTTVGLAIALAVGEYLLDNQTWTWKAVIIAAVGAAIKYLATRDDHKKTGKAVKKAVEETVIATQEVLEKRGEI